MRILPLIFLALMTSTGAAAAAGGRADLAGRWAFNWASDPSKTRCAKVEGKLLAELSSKSFTCSKTEQTNSASGHPVIQCERAKGSVSYLVFKTRAWCEEERKTQESNGD